MQSTVKAKASVGLQEVLTESKCDAIKKEVQDCVNYAMAAMGKGAWAAAEKEAAKKNGVEPVEHGADRRVELVEAREEVELRVREVGARRAAFHCSKSGPCAHCT